jgi:hypothetical protein
MGVTPAAAESFPRYDDFVDSPPPERLSYLATLNCGLHVDLTACQQSGCLNLKLSVGQQADQWLACQLNPTEAAVLGLRLLEASRVLSPDSPWWGTRGGGR